MTNNIPENPSKQPLTEARVETSISKNDMVNENTATHIEEQIKEMDPRIILKDLAEPETYKDGDEIEEEEEEEETDYTEKNGSDLEKKINKQKKTIQGIDILIKENENPNPNPAEENPTYNKLIENNFTKTEYEKLTHEEKKDIINGIKAAEMLNTYDSKILKTPEGKGIAQQIAKDLAKNPEDPKEITKDNYAEYEQQAKKLQEARKKGVNVATNLMKKTDGLVMKDGATIDSKADYTAYKELIEKHSTKEDIEKLTDEELQGQIEGMRARIELNEHIEKNKANLDVKFLESENGQKLVQEIAQEIAKNPNILDKNYLKEQIKRAIANGEEEPNWWQLLLLILGTVLYGAIKGAFGETDKK